MTSRASLVDAHGPSAGKPNRSATGMPATGMPATGTAGLELRCTRWRAACRDSSISIPQAGANSSVVTRDPGKGAAFYQAVFGYEAFDLPDDDDGLEHVLLSTHDYARASSNALPAEAVRAHPHWLNFVRVVSTPDAVAKVQALGGRVLVEPHPDRHGGLVAIVADPAGAPFGLLEWTAADSKEAAK